MKSEADHGHVDYRWFSRIQVEHDSLDRVFISLSSTLKTMAALDASTQDPDLLKDARDDLSFALDEMLEHFGAEEEAIFSQIRTHLPEFREAADQLERDHELLCQKTSQLRKMVLAARDGDNTLDLKEALHIVDETTQLLAKHNKQEVQLFFEAFERFNPEQRAFLIKTLQNH